MRTRSAAPPLKSVAAQIGADAPVAREKSADTAWLTLSSSSHNRRSSRREPRARWKERRPSSCLRRVRRARMGKCCSSDSFLPVAVFTSSAWIRYSSAFSLAARAARSLSSRSSSSSDSSSDSSSEPSPAPSEPPSSASAPPSSPPSPVTPSSPASPPPNDVPESSSSSTYSVGYVCRSALTRWATGMRRSVASSCARHQTEAAPMAATCLSSERSTLISSVNTLAPMPLCCERCAAMRQSEIKPRRCSSARWLRSMERMDSSMASSISSLRASSRVTVVSTSSCRCAVVLTGKDGCASPANSSGPRCVSSTSSQPSHLSLVAIFQVVVVSVSVPLNRNSSSSPSSPPLPRGKIFTGSGWRSDVLNRLEILTAR